MAKFISLRTSSQGDVWNALREMGYRPKDASKWFTERVKDYTTQIEQDDPQKSHDTILVDGDGPSVSVIQTDLEQQGVACRTPISESNLFWRYLIISRVDSGPNALKNASSVEPPTSNTDAPPAS